MRNWQRTFAEAATYTLYGVIALITYSVLSAGLSAIPGEYDVMFPVVQFGWAGQTPIARTYRDEDKVCWSVYIQKLREADSPAYDFYADGGDTSSKIPVAAYLVDEENEPIDPNSVMGKLLPHPPGQRWHRRYCFDVADRIPNFRAITVSGQARHSRWPHRWTTVTTVPEFTVEALVPDRPGGAAQPR